MKNNTIFVVGMLAIFLALGFVLAGCNTESGGGDSQTFEAVLFTGVTNADVVTYNYDSKADEPYTSGAKTFGFYRDEDFNYGQSDWTGYNVSTGSDNKLTVQLGTPGNDKLVPFPEGFYDTASVSPTSARFLTIETFHTTNDWSGAELEFSKILNANVSSFVGCSFIYCNTDAVFVATTGGIENKVKFKKGWNIFQASSSGYKWRIRE